MLKIMFDKNLLDVLHNNKLFNINFNKEYTSDEYKKLTFDRLKYLIKILNSNIKNFLTTPNVFMSVMNTLHLYDPSLAIAFGVNFGLFGGSLINFAGENNNLDEEIIKLNNGKIIGCLAITERGHGSNLKCLETVAIYDNNRQGFYIRTPTMSAIKTWIGNAQFATHAIVLAQLILNDKNYGLHPFLVMLNSNCKIISNGQKNGLNGVGNCFMIFNTFIKENQLLGRYGYVKDGTYIIDEKYKNNGKGRFADLLATLSGGRIVLASGANIIGVQALLKAYNYGKIRKQFNYSSLNYNEETAIINYPTYNVPLFENLCKMYCQRLFIDKVEMEAFNYYQEHKILNKKLHILTSIAKVISSESADECLRLGRRLCAGNGYKYENNFGNRYNDIDIYKTFEGDNTVLRIEIGGWALEKSLSAGYDTILEGLEEQLCKHLLYRFQDSNNYVETFNDNLLLVTKLADLHMSNTILSYLDPESFHYAVYRNMAIKESILIFNMLNISSPVVDGVRINFEFMDTIFNNIFHGVNDKYPELFNVTDKLELSKL